MCCILKWYAYRVELPFASSGGILSTLVPRIHICRFSMEGRKPRKKAAAGGAGGKGPSKARRSSAAAADPSKDKSLRKNFGRYNAVVEHDVTNWRRDWNRFMSNLPLKKQQESNTDTSEEGAAVARISSSIDLSRDESTTFGYLFGAKKSQKTTVKSAKKQERVGQSKMKKRVNEATSKGVALEGMNRKQRRQFLRLTVTDADVEASQRKVKASDLMDPKLQWYQQNPFPLDVLSEKLVTRKAIKHARQLGLKYNYLMPHPSWVAARALGRLLSKPIATGARTVLDPS